MYTFMYNELGILIERHYFVLYIVRYCPYFKFKKWRLTRFAMKLFISFSSFY